MNKEPYFSIVMPNYNHGHLIGESIQSVLNQDFDNWELIIIDNNSTDDSEQIIKSFKDSRINFYTIKNQGIIAKSRNLGIKKAKGEWIAFLDSDDIWYKNKFSFLHNLTNQNFDIICSNEYKVDKNLNQRSVLHYEMKSQNPYHELLIKGNSLSTSATIVKKSFLLQKNLLFDEDKNFITVEDYDLWIRSAFNKAKFYFCNKILGEYRIHFDNNSKRYNVHRKNLEILLRRHIFSNNISSKNQKKFWGKANSALITMDLKEQLSKKNYIGLLKILSSSNLIEVINLSKHFLSKIKLI